MLITVHANPIVPISVPVSLLPVFFSPVQAPSLCSHCVSWERCCLRCREWLCRPGRQCRQTNLKSVQCLNPAASIRPSGNPAPPSLSNPKIKEKPITKFYPASSQETADAILADSLGRLYEQGDEHFHKGEFNHTINLNKIVVQGDPHNVEAYAVSAYLLWSTTRNAEAVTVVKAGIKGKSEYVLYV